MKALTKKITVSMWGDGGDNSSFCSAVLQHIHL